MDQEKKLQDRCRVVSGAEGDRFVGVKVNAQGAIVQFPIGYQLSGDETNLRADIRNLLGTLSFFDKKEGLIETHEYKPSENVEFPIHAYLKVITSFLETGHYYTEREPKYRTGTKGNVSWSRTIRKQRAFVQQNGSLVFTNMVVRSVSPNEDNQITQIHKLCVYEAFDKLGWLFVLFRPNPPDVHIDFKEAIYVLTKRLATTHNDEDQELLGAMKKMLEYMDERNLDQSCSFGTDYFERVWERMIDEAVGESDKSKYFPKVEWHLDYGQEKRKPPLYPDSIMVYKDKYYVLDAKYYRYGRTGNAGHLPNGSDINKQITYGEHLYHRHKISKDKLFNAFILPYNRKENPFGFGDIIGNIGEAVGDWRSNLSNYERIQGIVIDTKFLMTNYMSGSNRLKKSLAQNIEKGLLRRAVVDKGN